VAISSIGQRFIEPAEQAHQVQAIRMIGIGGNGLLATKLRVEKPSGPQMVDPGLDERGGIDRPPSTDLSFSLEFFAAARRS
jgi:hypothetical protein